MRPVGMEGLNGADFSSGIFTRDATHGVDRREFRWSAWAAASRCLQRRLLMKEASLAKRKLNEQISPGAKESGDLLRKGFTAFLLEAPAPLAVPNPFQYRLIAKNEHKQDHDCAAVDPCGHAAWIAHERHSIEDIQLIPS